MARAENAEMTQAERTRRSTSALLNAAAELIVEGGFEAMTFAAIGERAGYSRGLVTSRFGSKDGLVEALIGRIVGVWGDRNIFPYTRGQSGLAQVVIALDAVRWQAASDTRSLRVLYALIFEALGRDEVLRRRIADLHVEMRRDFADWINRGLQDGSIRSGISPNTDAALIVSELRGIGFQWLLDPERFNPVPSLEYMRDATYARLGSPKAPKNIAALLKEAHAERSTVAT
jgi:AcrR family transcriptional regulator